MDAAGLDVLGSCVVGSIAQKAAIHVNSELIRPCYGLGEEISKTSFKAAYGNRFHDLLSVELKKAIPNTKRLNHKNLKYAERFYT